MNIYTIADLHLSFHEKIDKPMSVFGPGWDQYEERLRAQCEAMISPEDILILPGDLSWGLSLEEAMPDLEWIHRLPGQKVLIRGNHDLWWSRIRYLKTLYDDMFFLQNDCYYIGSDRTGGESIAICGTRGWILPEDEDFTAHDEKIYRRELGRLRASLEMAGSYHPDRIIVATHYPPASSWKGESEFTRLMREFPVRECVYGHLHGMPAFLKGIKGMHDGICYYLTSLDYLGAKPKRIWPDRRAIQ